jgi:transcriptional regulator with XRE-family HTH domain
MVLKMLKTIREAKEYTKDELAAKAGTSVRNISYLEAGHGTTLNTAKRIAKALHCTIPALRGE